jgi:CRP-like cAMP-binding protein
VIVEDDVDLQELILIEAGNVLVEVDGETVAKLGPGQFVGEFSFLTNGRTSARCVAANPVRYAVWPRIDFEKMVERYPDANLAIYSVLGIDLVQKLMQRNRPMPEAAI